MEHILGKKMSDKEVDDVMVSREEKVDGNTEFNSPLLHKSFMDLVEDEFADDEEMQEKAEVIKTLHRVLQEKRAKLSSCPSAAAASASAEVSASSSSEAPGPPLAHLLPFPVHGDRVYTQAMAKPFLPPGWSITKRAIRDPGWQVVCRKFTKARAFDPSSRQADYDALSYVLLAAWREHKRQTGVDCPFNFPGVP
jgi:hypothetical protein